MAVTTPTLANRTRIPTRRKPPVAATPPVVGNIYHHMHQTNNIINNNILNNNNHHHHQQQQPQPQPQQVNMCADINNYYHIHDKKLGEGGFAKVRLATHLATRQYVAIKCLDKVKLGPELPRIYNEIECLKRLKHHNIARLYQVFETATMIYLVLEYCAGGELFDYIVSKSRLEETESAQIIHDLMRVLDFIHANGFAHRDLKPENVLFDDKHHIKLIDFGLAANCSADNLASNQNQRPLDQLSTCCGSVTYAAPEVISGNVYSGTLVDVWSAGVMLYALLVGQLPFNDHSIPKLYQKIQAGIKTLPSFLSAEACDLIRKMLTIDPKQRITVRDVLQHPWLRNRCHSRRPPQSSPPRQVVPSPAQPVKQVLKEQSSLPKVDAAATAPAAAAQAVAAPTSLHQVPLMAPAPPTPSTPAVGDNQQENSHHQRMSNFVYSGQTPKKSIVKRLLESATPSKQRQPRRLLMSQNDGIVNITLTRYKDPNICLSHFQEALVRKGFHCKRKDFSLKCFNQSIRLVLEVCIYNNQCAIQRKRIKGDAWQYKLVCEEILRFSNSSAVGGGTTGAVCTPKRHPQLFRERQNTSIHNHKNHQTTGEQQATAAGVAVLGQTTTNNMNKIQ